MGMPQMFVRETFQGQSRLFAPAVLGNSQFFWRWTRYLVARSRLKVDGIRVQQNRKMVGTAGNASRATPVPA